MADCKKMQTTRWVCLNSS